MLLSARPRSHRGSRGAPAARLPLWLHPDRTATDEAQVYSSGGRQPGLLTNARYLRLRRQLQFVPFQTSHRRSGFRPMPGVCKGLGRRLQRRCPRDRGSGNPYLVVDDRATSPGTLVEYADSAPVGRPTGKHTVGLARPPRAQTPRRSDRTVHRRSSRPDRSSVRPGPGIRRASVKTLSTPEGA